MVMDRQKRYIIGRRTTWISLLGNVFLSFFKLLAGFLGSSAAMIADGVHSLSDVISTIVIMVSLKVSSKPPDEEHPYGHGKAEAIGAKLVALLLIGAGIFLGWEGINKIVSGEISVPGRIALWGVIASLIVKEVLFRYVYKVGKMISSKALITDAWHHRSDAFSSLAALVGIVGALLGWPFMDPLAAVVVAVFILKVGWGLVSRAVDELMDAVPDLDLQDRLEDKARGSEGVIGVENLRLRTNGPYFFVDLSLVVDKGLSAYDAHEIAAKVKQIMLEEDDRIQDVLIHVDPAEIKEDYPYQE